MTGVQTCALPISLSGPGELLVDSTGVLTATGGDKGFSGLTVHNNGIIALNLSNNRILSLGGTLNNNATGVLRFANGAGSLNSVGGDSNAGAAINNAGVIEQAGNGAARLDNGLSSLVLNNNGGKLRETANGSLELSSGNFNYSGVSTFSGDSMRITGGSHRFTNGSHLSGSALHINGGTIDILAGAAGMTVDPGLALTLAPGVAIQGPGLLVNQGSLTLSGNQLRGDVINLGDMVLSGSNSFSAGGTSFTQEGGTLTLNNGAALFKDSGDFNWTGGSIIGHADGLAIAGQVASARVRITGSTDKLLDGPTFRAELTNQSDGVLEVRTGQLAAGATTIGPDATVLVKGGSVVTTSLANQGLVQVDGGNFQVTGSGTQTGTFRVANNASVGFLAGTQTFDGASLDGPGHFERGNATLVLGARGLTVGSSASLDLAALAFTGTGAIVNNGVVTGDNVSIPGDFINGANAGAFLSGGSSIAGNFRNSGVFEIAGTVSLNGAIAEQLGNEIRIPVGATLRRTNGPLNWVNGTIGGTEQGSGTLSFVNGGSFQFAGNGVRVIDGLNIAFTDLTLPNGSLTLMSGSLTLNGATVLPADAVLNLTGGTLTNVGSVQVAGSFGLTGGTFTGPGSLSMAARGSLNLPSNNAVAWSSTGDLSNTGVLNLSNATITNSVINQGTINLGTGLSFSRKLTNNGTLLAQAGNTVLNGGLEQNAGGSTTLSGGSLQGAVTLTGGNLSVAGGTLLGPVTQGGGSLTLSSGTLQGAVSQNGGNITVSGGTLIGPLTQSVGGVTLSGGVVQGAVTLAGSGMALAGGTVQGALALNAGTLSGNGTVNGDVAVGNATVSPGASAGAISINGNLTLAPTSTLRIELGGLVQASEYDVIRVRDAASLAGALTVINVGDFLPPAGSSYNFMSFASSSGSFSSKNLPLAPIMALATAPTGLSMVVDTPVAAEPIPVVVAALATIVNEVLSADPAEIKTAVDGEQKEEKRKEAQAKASVVNTEPEVATCP